MSVFDLRGLDGTSRMVSAVMAGRQMTVGLLLAVLVMSPACIHVEMTPETEERQTEVSEDRAGEYRVYWTEQFQGSSPYEQGQLIRNSIDSLAAGFIRYGYQIADQWQEFNKQSGNELSPADMTQKIDEWNRTQQPLFDAYAGTLEFGLSELRRTRYLDQQTIDLLQQGVDLYREIFVSVFRPSGNPDDYERRLDALRMDIDSHCRTLDENLRQYR